MGLRLRLFIVLIVPLTLLVGLYAVVRVRDEEAQLLAAEQRDASVAARAIQIAVENAVRDRQLADIRRLLSELVNRQEQIDRIRIFDKSLEPTLESEPGAVGGPVAAERIQRVMTQGRAGGRRGGRGIRRHLLVSDAAARAKGRWWAPSRSSSPRPAPRRSASAPPATWSSG